MTIDVGSIEQRLDPNIMAPEVPDATDAGAQAKEAVETAHEKPKRPDPREQNPYVFAFKWTDGRGKLWEGEFENKILTLKERQQAGILRARLQSGLPVDSLDALTQEINLMIAHMSISLQDKPDWAEDLQAQTNIQLVQSLYEEVNGHEATFHGYPQAEAGS